MLVFTVAADDAIALYPDPLLSYQVVREVPSEGGVPVPKGSAPSTQKVHPVTFVGRKDTDVSVDTYPNVDKGG